MRTIKCTLAAILLAAAMPVLAQELPVYQNLDEVTSRIPNLKGKPIQKLVDANKGYLQSEIIIFKDAESGNEVWALSREECNDMAHTGRRPAWSTNGQYISFKGDVGYFDFTTNKLAEKPWGGTTYVANADGSMRRRLFGDVNGKLQKFDCAKYNMWDAKKPNVWYTASKDILWRVTIAGLKDSKAEAIYKFPSAGNKAIQEICDANYMLIEEDGANATFYVVNLNKDPKDPKFCLTAPLKGAIHSGSFRFHRGNPIIVTGGYEKPLTGGVCYKIDDEKGLVETTMPNTTEGKVEMAHLWYGPPDDRVGFFGRYNGKSALYLMMPGKEPVMVADLPDGHVTWCGRDPEWFFAVSGASAEKEKGKDGKFVHKLIACNIDGKTVKLVCTPFDRRRPGGTEDYGAIPLPTQSRDGTKCWFHSSMLLSTSKNTGSYIGVFRKPYAPTELTLKAGTGVELEWTPHVIGSEVKGFHVYRSDDGKTFTELTDKAVEAKSYKDTTAQSGKTYTYAVTAEEWSRLESDTTSPPLKVEVAADGAKSAGKGEPVKDWDKAAPAAVKDFKAVVKDGLITLQWSGATDKDYRYYNVYASSTGKPDVNQKRLLVSPPHDDLSYIDWTAPKGKTINYAITVIDRQGNESAPVFASCESPAVGAPASAPVKPGK